jgi:glycosyltransferase involved in cell wall biosynthesis
MKGSQRRAVWDGKRPISLFHFGRRTSASGLDSLLAALQQLPSDKFELVLAGGEGDPDIDQHLARTAKDVPIHFFGPYQTSQLAALAAACDLAVFPSGTDRGLGLVIDEALALGLPVWCCEEADPLGRIRPVLEPDGEAGRGLLKRVESRPGRILRAESSADWLRAFEELLEDPEQLQAERHAIPRSFETTKDTVDRLESLLSGLHSQAVSRAS